MKKSITSQDIIKELNTSITVIEKLIKDDALTPSAVFSNNDVPVYIFDNSLTLDDVRRLIDGAQLSGDAIDSDLFTKFGGEFSENKQTGERFVKSTMINWMAVLQTEFNGTLVVDKGMNELYVRGIKDGVPTFTALPSSAELLYIAASKYSLTEPSSSTKNLDAAVSFLSSNSSHLVSVNQYEERLKAYSEKWDGKDRMGEVLKKLLGTKQPDDIVRAIAHSWFKGAVHNWVRDESESVYPISIDINGEQQGSGKTFFANIVAGAILGEGHNVKTDTALDLTDQQNTYKVIVSSPVINDDEHITSNMSRSRNKGEGVDPDAALKNMMQAGKLSWLQKHQNNMDTRVVRTAWIRTTNSTKSYSSSMTGQLERRFMVVLAETHDTISEKEYYDYMVQVLGQAYQIYMDEGFDIRTDTLMPESIKEYMRLQQQNGSNRSGLYEKLDSMMETELALGAFAGAQQNTTDVLSGRRSSYESVSKLLPAHKHRYVRLQTIVDALYTYAKMSGPTQARTQVESVVKTWLKDNGYTLSPKDQVSFKNTKYKSVSLYVNPSNETDDVPDIDVLAEAEAKLNGLDVLTTPIDELNTIIADIMGGLTTLSPEQVSRNALKYQGIMSQVASILEHITKL